MADYTGNRCIVCSEQFKEGNDIVVCPECGTPYHRACYEKYGSCVNTELHKAKRSWTPIPDTGVPTYTEEDDPEKDCVCPRCGYVNPKLTAFCGRCGSPMPSLERHNENLRKNMQDAMQNDENAGGINLEPYLINFTDPLCGYNPDEDFEGVRLCELADYVKTNTHYYLPNFKRFKETGSSLSWNFSAMIMPELYFSYRKMPLIALAAFVVRFLFMIPQYIPILAQFDAGILSQFAQSFDIRSTAFSVLNVLSYILMYAAMFFFGAFANKIYYKLAVKRTAKIKERTTPLTIRQTLRSKGGTSALWLTLFICIYIMPYMIVNALMGFNIFFGGTA